MPRPRPVLPPPPPPTSVLINNATQSSTHIFHQQALAVLKHSSSSFLKRRLSQRLHDAFSKCSYETLANCTDTTSLLSNLESPLEILEQDIIDCNVFAKRVGLQWERVLRSRGFCDYADVVMEFVERGSYLEGDEGEDRVEQTIAADNIGQGEEENPAAGFNSIDEALNKLHRYQTDCDGSGHPSKHISSLTDIDCDGVSSARKAIQKIDRMMQSINNEELKSNYGYDWDAINEAVKRNEKRLYVFQKISDDDVDGYEIVPKLLDGVEDTDMDTLRERVVRFKDGDTSEAAHTDLLLANNSRTASILRRKRKREKKPEMDENDSIGSSRGRPPSTVCETEWTWQDILDAIPVCERKKLINEYIHPPWPQEKDDEQIENHGDEKDDGTEDKEPIINEDYSAIVCGALRQLGSTHLWEQTQNQKIDSQSSSELQKKTIGKLLRERVRPREFMLSKKKSGFSDKLLGKKCKSKTAWTEDFSDIDGLSNVLQKDDGLGLEHDEGNGFQQAATSLSLEQNSKQYLEMDLGECTVEVAAKATGGSGDTDEAQPMRKMLAFRSLELALKF